MQNTRAFYCPRFVYSPRRHLPPALALSTLHILHCLTASSDNSGGREVKVKVCGLSIGVMADSNPSEGTSVNWLIIKEGLGWGQNRPCLCTASPKKQVFHFFCPYITQIIVQKNLYFLLTLLQLSNQKKKSSAEKKIFGGHFSPPPPYTPKVTPRTEGTDIRPLRLLCVLYVVVSLMSWWLVQKKPV